MFAARDLYIIEQINRLRCSLVHHNTTKKTYLSNLQTVGILFWDCVIQQLRPNLGPIYFNLLGGVTVKRQSKWLDHRLERRQQSKILNTY